MDSGYVLVDEGRLYYEVAGKGDPVVLIHAGFLDSRMWDDQFKLFADCFKVIRYDVRGFGKSDIPHEKFTNSNDLYTLLKQLQVSKTSLVGLSNGGAISLDFTVEHPEMVKRLILIGTGVRGYENTPEEEKIWNEFDERMKPQEAVIRQNRLADAVEMDVEVWAAAQNAANRKRITKIAMDNAHSHVEPPGRWHTKPEQTTFKRLHEIEVPTLLIVGDKDVKGMPLISQRVHDLIADSRIEIIKGADHLVNLSKPNEFNRLVLEFLTDQD